MKNLILFLIVMTTLSACKKKCTGCGEHQQCVDGVCQCQQWYEGSNCETKMIDKFNGTFIGITYINSANPFADTFTFQSTLQANVANSVNSTLSPEHNETAISSLGSTSADYIQFFGVPNQSGTFQRKTGKAIISLDGSSLSLIFSPLHGGGIVDSSTLYTFIGIKQ